MLSSSRKTLMAMVFVAVVTLTAGCNTIVVRPAHKQLIADHYGNVSEFRNRVVEGDVEKQVIVDWLDQEVDTWASLNAWVAGDAELIPEN